MPLTVATNPQTNETLVLVDNQWQKAEQVAAHGQTGEKAYLVSGKWLTDQGPDTKTPAPPPEKGPVGKAAGAAGDFLSGVGDVGATLASGAVAPVVAGLAGAGQAVSNAYQSAGHALAPNTIAAPTTSAADVVQNVGDSLTYQPRTRGGAEYVQAITTPLRMLAEGGDKAGGYVAEKTGSPALGAAVNTAVQMAPGLIEPGLRAGKGFIAPKGAAAATAAAPAATSAAAAATEAATRAQAYAANRLGVDWNSLSQNFKDTLTSIAGDAKKLDALPVEAVKRQAQLQSLRVPITTTAAKLTRDSTALRNEANVAATDAGKPIRDSDIQVNRDLRANVEGLRQQVGGVGKTRATANDPGVGARAEEVGRQVQERALRTKETVSKANYNRLYKEARESDPEATVSTQAVQDLAKTNPGVQHLDWVPSWFKKAASTKGVESLDHVTLTELHDLRSTAGDIARTGGKEGYQAGKVVEAIDKAMEEAPASAAKWKAANKAFREHKNEFEETAAVERNVADKSKNDPKVALEDTWKRAVQTAKLEEIRQLKRSLLSGGDAATRTAGKKALRELKQETVNQYLDYITRKTGTNEAGETQITAVQMVEGLKHIGGEARVREILGERALKEMKNLIEAAKIAKTEPTIRNAGSSTMQNLLAFAEKFIDKVPVVGDTLGGVVKGVGKLKEMGEGGRVAREAVKQPTDKAATQVKRQTRAEKRRGELKKALRKVGPAGASSMTLRDDTDLGKSP